MTQAAKQSQVGVWFMSEFLRRTIRLRDGCGDIMDAAPPEYRVAWSEITAKAHELGMTEDVGDLRLWWGDWMLWLAKMERLDDSGLKHELAQLTRPCDPRTRP